MTIRTVIDKCIDNGAKRISINKNAKDITGTRFGRLIALIPVGRTNKNIVWLCKCVCGNYVDVVSKRLRRRETRSCGCLQREVAANRQRTHGLSHSPEYGVWVGIRRRCEIQKNKAYRYYGGRGVKVCSRWASFENFYADMGKRPDGYQIDRIDNDGDYTPENCRWATKREQMNNKRSNRFIEYDGRRLTLAQWGRRTGLNRSTIKARIDVYGWSVERSLTAPLQKYRREECQ